MVELEELKRTKGDDPILKKEYEKKYNMKTALESRLRKK